MLPVLHGRASAWSEGAGFFDGAIRHAIAAKDYERASMLVARHSFTFAFAGQAATVERWLESLPEELVTHDAALVLVKAWISALSGRREETEWLLALAEGIPYEGPLPDGTASIESGVALIRGVFGYAGVKQWLERSRCRRVGVQADLTADGVGVSRLGAKPVLQRRYIRSPEAVRRGSSFRQG